MVSEGRKKTTEDQYVIIGGTMKAATTSVFNYLSAHPQVCGSSVKETAFFIRDYMCNVNLDKESYLKYFTHCKSNARIRVEGSTGYLEYGKVVAERIKNLIPNTKLLFILREPIDRLNSYYNYCVGQLKINKDISFAEYIERSMKYASGESPFKLNVNEDHLKVLELGRYVQYLKEFYRVISKDQIKVMFYEQLKTNTLDFMFRLSNFLEIDPGFYKDYNFNKANVTFSSKVELLHRITLYLNKKLEGTLRQRPKIKRNIVTVYKYFNKKSEGYSGIPETLVSKLQEYYKRSNKELAALLLGEETESWVR